jgi:hypothetical protein
VTSPENFRRRQRWELALVLIIMVGSLFYGWFDGDRDRERRACMAKSFQESANVQNQRADLGKRSRALQREVDDSQNQVFEDVQIARTSKDVARAFAKFNKSDRELDRRFFALQRESSALEPVKLPDGLCGADLKDLKETDR